MISSVTQFSAVAATALALVLAIEKLIQYVMRESSKPVHSKRPPSLPRLPVLGNIHEMIKRKLTLPMLFNEVAKQVGSIFTFWFGSYAVVVVNDYSTALELLKKDTVADRPRRGASEIIKSYQGE